MLLTEVGMAKPRNHRAEGRHPGEEMGESTAHQAEDTQHTAVGGTSVYSPNRPTWVSIRDRSSSCVQEGSQAGWTST